MSKDFDFKNANLKIKADEGFYFEIPNNKFQKNDNVLTNGFFLSTVAKFI